MMTGGYPLVFMTFAEFLKRFKTFEIYFSIITSRSVGGIALITGISFVQRWFLLSGSWLGNHKWMSQTFLMTGKTAVMVFIWIQRAVAAYHRDFIAGLQPDTGGTGFESAKIDLGATAFQQFPVT